MLKYKSIKISEFFPKPYISYRSIKAEVDISNHATKAN